MESKEINQENMHLPVELWYDIFSFFRRKELLKMRKSCHLFRNIADSRLEHLKNKELIMYAIGPKL